MSEPAISRCAQLQSCALWRILDTTRHLATPMGVDEILRKTLASALQVLNADRSSVFLYDPKTHELYTKVAAAQRRTDLRDGTAADDAVFDDPAVSPMIRFPADKGIAGETAQKRRLVNVPDCYADPRFNREVDRKTGYVTRSLLSVPLLGVDGALVGVLQLLNKRDGTFDEEDEQVAMILAAHCAVVLQRAMLLEEYVLKQKMERDLALARDIQQSSLPNEMPVLAGYELDAWSRPADETGGDIYDAVVLGDERVALLMADATGHGVGPALSASQFRAMFRMGLLLGAELGELMTKVNLQLKTDLPVGRFVTAFAGILDSSEHKIFYHSGGQAPLMHYHAGQQRVEWLEASAPPLGILAHVPMVPPPPIHLQPGDIFGVISDGFLEASNRAGEQFGEERIAGLLRSCRLEPLETVRHVICESVRVFAEDCPQEDDMTIVLVRRRMPGR